MTVFKQKSRNDKWHAEAVKLQKLYENSLLSQIQVD